jgi:hypothetical protein
MKFLRTEKGSKREPGEGLIYHRRQGGAMTLNITRYKLD